MRACCAGRPPDGALDPQAGAPLDVDDGAIMLSYRPHELLTVTVR